MVGAFVGKSVLHTPLVQMLYWQSLSALQALPGAQPLHLGPPQSTSDSPWFRMPSMHVA